MSDNPQVFEYEDAVAEGKKVIKENNLMLLIVSIIGFIISVGLSISITYQTLVLKKEFNSGMVAGIVVFFIVGLICLLMRFQKKDPYLAGKKSLAKKNNGAYVKNSEGELELLANVYDSSKKFIISSNYLVICSTEEKIPLSSITKTSLNANIVCRREKDRFYYDRLAIVCGLTGTGLISDFEDKYNDNSYFSCKYEICFDNREPLTILDIKNKPYDDGKVKRELLARRIKNVLDIDEEILKSQSSPSPEQEEINKRLKALYLFIKPHKDENVVNRIDF